MKVAVALYFKSTKMNWKDTYVPPAESNARFLEDTKHHSADESAAVEDKGRSVWKGMVSQCFANATTCHVSVSRVWGLLLSLLPAGSAWTAWMADELSPFGKLLVRLKVPTLRKWKWQDTLNFMLTPSCMLLEAMKSFNPHNEWSVVQKTWLLVSWSAISTGHLEDSRFCGVWIVEWHQIVEDDARLHWLCSDVRLQCFFSVVAAILMVRPYDPHWTHSDSSSPEYTAISRGSNRQVDWTTRSSTYCHWGPRNSSKAFALSHQLKSRYVTHAGTKNISTCQ